MEATHENRLLLSARPGQSSIGRAMCFSLPKGVDKYVTRWEFCRHHAPRSRAKNIDRWILVIVFFGGSCSNDGLCLC